MGLRRAVAALGLVLAGGAAQAGRPLVTEDAHMLPHRACQLEAWMQRDEGSTQTWAQPACNPTGHFEAAVGAGLVREEQRTRSAFQLVQLKFVPRSVEDHPWGVGVVLGSVRDRRSDATRRGPGDAFVVVPVSFALDEAGSRLHLNAGAQRARETRQRVGLWAIGADVAIAPGVSFHPEVFRSQPGRPYYQLGASYALRDGVVIDAAFGDRLRKSDAERWFTVGITLEVAGALAFSRR